MAEGVAADLMAAGVERADLVALDQMPVGIRRAAGAARDIERTFQAVPFEHRRAVEKSGIGNVIESEADQRRRVSHFERLGAVIARGTAKMPAPKVAGDR